MIKGLVLGIGLCGVGVGAYYLGPMVAPEMDWGSFWWGVASTIVTAVGGGGVFITVALNNR